jgi:hypothetical protein
LDLEKFSVISTSIENDRLKNIIKKKYKKNTQIPLSTKELKKLIDNYILILKKSEIPIPYIVQSYIEDEFIVYETKYCGKNIVELGFNISKFDNFKDHIVKMIKIIKKAIKNNIHFDPHPKNFVFNKKGEIFYVDFYPPYSNSLKKMRLSIANIDHAELIKKNFSFFTKDFLPEHFCGDFLNIDKDSEIIFNKIYSLEKELGISLNDQKKFIDKAKYIRSVEDLRLEKKIFLL